MTCVRAWLYKRRMGKSVCDVGRSARWEVPDSIVRGDSVHELRVSSTNKVWLYQQ